MTIYSVSIPNNIYHAAEPSTRDVLARICERWDGVSPIDKAYITQLLGGKKDANRVRAIIDNLIYADREDGLAVMYGEMMGERLATLMNNILPIDWDVDDDDDEWDDDDDEYDDLSYDDINWENIDWDDLIFGDYCGNEYEEGQITVDDVMPNIERVIFNNPATIVYWDDGTKTVVKCQDGDTYSQETGLAMAIAKKVFGNNSSYNEVFKQWVEQGSK